MVRLSTAVALAIITLVARVALAQTTQIEADLQLAEDILSRLATENLTQVGRESLQAELRRIEEKEYVVRMTLVARPYTAGSGYFPVKVSTKGLLEPAVDGRIEMPKSKSRRAKSQLHPAYGTVRIHVVEGVTPRASKTLESVWVNVDGDVWYVTSDDARLARPEPAPTPPMDVPSPTDEVVEVRLLIAFDEGSGDALMDATGDVQGTIDGQHRWVDGRYGRALDLNGSATVSFAAIPQLHAAADSVSVGAWVKPASLEGMQGIARPGGVPWQIGFYGTTFEMTVWGDKLKATHYTSKELRLHEWVHVAATYDTRTVRLYINGRLDAEVQTPGEPSLNLAGIRSLTFGSNLGASQRLIDAAVDDLFLTDEVLTQQQIVQVMNGFVAPKVADEEDANTPTWRSRAVLAAQGDAEARAVAFLSESALAVGYSDGQVRIWDVDTGGISGTLPGPSEVMAMRAVPQGNRLFVAYLHTIRVWSVEQLEVLETLGGELGRTWCLSVDSNG